MPDHPMTFRILGALEVDAAGGAVLSLGAPKQRALLAILLLHVGEIVPTDQLIDLLWGERAPRTAAHSIQIYVSELRRILAPSFGDQPILTRPPGYLLDVAADRVDAKRFERMAGEGTRMLAADRRVEGVALLREALRLWRGPALTDFTYEEFAQPYIRRLHDLHLDAIEELAAAELDAGRATAVVSLAEAAVQEDPLRERSRELLMLALYRTGRHAEALRTYKRLSEALDEELGVQPSPALRRLHERIIIHDPTLGLDPSDDDSPPPDSRNPYKGLQAFGEADADDFFGRDGLVDRLHSSLSDGARLLALVGPSGSGKSSLVAAGLLPRVRGGWTILHVTPDREGLAAMVALRSSADSPLLVVIDQFEELFTSTDERFQKQFLDELLAQISEQHGPAAVVTLRADFYDRPLLYPAFAKIFLAAVINVLPMTADELEAAVVRPAERAGVAIEPALVATLIADTADQPGALPLLQYALTEIFDQRTSSALKLADFRALGGLRGLLSRRAEELFERLDPAEQRTAMQIFLRLVRPGRGTADSRRRLPLAELTATDLDPVSLSRVLDIYAQHRLLSFDRDPATGAATVEVAHEALLWEWDRLAGWIDRHRTALRRHESFVAALEEWEDTGRDPGFLLSGSRLDEFVNWDSTGTLHLTAGEREFLTESQDQRSADARSAEANSIAVRRLERRSRLRLAAVIALGILLAAVGGWSLFARGDEPPTVGLLFHAAGEVDQLLEAGFDRGVADFGLLAIERDTSVESAETALEALSAESPDLIVVATLATDVPAIASLHPDVRYVDMTEVGGEAGNVTNLSFADHEGAFLAGAVAALHSETRIVGFIGGIDIPPIWHFQAGFEAGVRAIDPQITVETAYLTAPPNYEGFVSPDLGQATATELYQRGADVIFHAAGDSGTGVFEAAAQLSSDVDRHLWVIGVDSDQYLTIGGPRASTWRDHILTSVVKRFDNAVYQVLSDESQGKLTAGAVELGLAANAIELSYSGGRIDDYAGPLNEFRDQIISGAITVPCVPIGRQEPSVGVGLGTCGN